MSKSIEELRLDVVEIGKLMFQKSWVAANDGNISARLDETRILCTPTGLSKGMMKPDDLLICDYEGNRLEGVRDRTSEIEMHLAIYRMRPDVHAIVHAHPPVATGFASAGRALNLALLPEVVICLGSVPLAEYGLPGTPEVTEGMLPYIPKYNAILMANHGAVAYGPDLYQAYFRMETVEHFARIAFVAEMVGGAKPLPRREVAKLFAARGRYGFTTGPQPETGLPLAAEDLSPAERTGLTRAELVEIIDEALRARGVLA